MVDLRSRWAAWRRDPWLIVVALLALACPGPTGAQLLGWWHADAAQRDAVDALTIGEVFIMCGGNWLFGRRRCPVSRRPGDVAVLGFLGMSVALGIVGVATGAGALLGVVTALPIGGSVFRLLLAPVYITTLLLRPRSSAVL